VHYFSNFYDYSILESFFNHDMHGLSSWLYRKILPFSTEDCVPMPFVYIKNEKNNPEVFESMPATKMKQRKILPSDS
jgi:hypothetical protein